MGDMAEESHPIGIRQHALTIRPGLIHCGVRYETVEDLGGVESTKIVRLFVSEADDIHNEKRVYRISPVFLMSLNDLLERLEEGLFALGVVRKAIDGNVEVISTFSVFGEEHFMAQCDAAKHEDQRLADLGLELGSFIDREVNLAARRTVVPDSAAADEFPVALFSWRLEGEADCEGIRPDGGLATGGVCRLESRKIGWLSPIKRIRALPSMPV